MTDLIREARPDDLPYLAANLRDADQIEILATTGRPDYLEELKVSAEGSDEVLVGLPGPQKAPFVIFGYHVWRKTAFIWAVATPAIQQNRVRFLRAGKPVLKRWFEENPSVDYFMNFTHARNTLHHRWLEWCGADMLPAVPMGPLGELFHPFTIKREKYACATSV